jgi:hypothetical protein
VEETPHAAYEEFLIDDHYRRAEQKLDEGYGDGIIGKRGREGETPHDVTHSRVHQREA